jgi:VWFA-related protein
MMARRLVIPLALLFFVLAASPGIDVYLVEPGPGQIVIGEVPLVAEVSSDEPVTRVEFFVDGTLVGTASQPPYRVLTDVGPDNVEHLIEVIAHGESGSRAVASLTTTPIQISGEFEFDLQQLYVTASRRGEAVHDLKQEDFEVRDKGKRQKIVSFARGDIPFTAVLLVDASQSMVGEKLVSAQRGVRDFADRMRPLDEVKLVVFSDNIRAVSPFTSYSDILTAGLERVTAVGGTAVNDVLYVALSRLEERQGRRVVILLSDAIDAHSALGMRHVLPSARRSRAIVYVIRTMAGARADEPDKLSGAKSPWRDEEGHRAEFRQLVSLVDESGGKVFGVESAAGIEAAFQEIFSELRDHYVLGYYPSNQRGDGSWHKVRVKVSRPGTDLRTSSGYLDY